VVGPALREVRSLSCRVGQDETGHCAKPFRSRSPDAQLPIREHHEAAREGIETLFLKCRMNAAHKRIGARFTKPHEEKASMRSGLELAHIREIQILRNQEPLLSLRGAPDVAVRLTLKTSDATVSTSCPKGDNPPASRTGMFSSSLTLMHARARRGSASPPPRKLPRTQ
jgi:hypothetical protein